jgi:hypothetical protein
MCGTCKRNAYVINKSILIFYKPKGRGFDSDEVIGLSSMTYSFQPHHGSGVYSASNRNEYRKIFGDRERPACKANNLMAIHEPIVETMWSPRYLASL